MTAQILLSTQCDLHSMVRYAEEQLRQGQKVELHFKFRGPEMADTNVGFDVVHRALFRLATVGRTDREPKLIGRNIRATLSPVR